MKYQSQLTVILEKLARDGSVLNLHATPELCKRIREGEIRYVAATKTHRGLSPDVHKYIAEILLWEDLWGDLPFPGIKPDELKEFEKNNPGVRTGGRFKLGEEELPERRSAGSHQSNAESQAHNPTPSALTLNQPYHKENYASDETTKEPTRSSVQIPRGPSHRDNASAKKSSKKPQKQPSIQWKNTHAEQLNQAFYAGIAEQQRSKESYRREWVGPGLGWDPSTGLPNNAVVVVHRKAYPSICGPNGSYASAIDKEWGPDFQLEYQRLVDDHSIAVWPEPVTGFAASSTLFQGRINHLVQFLQYWSQELERGFLSINETWSYWKENQDLEGKTTSTESYRRRRSPRSPSSSSTPILRQIKSPLRHRSDSRQAQQDAAERSKRARYDSLAQEMQKPSAQSIPEASKAGVEEKLAPDRDDDRYYETDREAAWLSRVAEQRSLRAIQENDGSLETESRRKRGCSRERSDYGGDRERERRDRRRRLDY